MKIYFINLNNFIKHFMPFNFINFVSILSIIDIVSMIALTITIRIFDKWETLTIYDRLI